MSLKIVAIDQIRQGPEKPREAKICDVLTAARSSDQRTADALKVNPFSHLPGNGIGDNLHTPLYVRKRAEGFARKIKEVLETLEGPSITQKQFDSLDLETRLPQLLAEHLEAAALGAFSDHYSSTVATKVLGLIEADEATLGVIKDADPSTIFYDNLDDVDEKIKRGDIESLNTVLSKTGSELKENLSRLGQKEAGLDDAVAQYSPGCKESGTTIIQKYQVTIETIRKLSHQISRTFISEYLHHHTNLKPPGFSYDATLQLVNDNQDELRLTAENLTQIVSQIIVSTKHPCESLNPEFLVILSDITASSLASLTDNSFNSRGLIKEMSNIFQLPFLECRKPAGPLSEANIKDVRARITDWSCLQDDGATKTAKKFDRVFECRPVQLIGPKEEPDGTRPSVRITKTSWKLDVDGDFLMNAQTLLLIYRQQVAESSHLYNTSALSIKISKSLADFDNSLAQLVRTLVREEISKHIDLEEDFDELPLAKIITEYSAKILDDRVKEKLQPVFQALITMKIITEQRQDISRKLAATYQSRGENGYTSPDLLASDIDGLCHLVQGINIDDEHLKSSQNLIATFQKKVETQGFMNCSGQHRQEGEIFLTILIEMLRPFMTPGEFEASVDNLDFWIKMYLAIGDPAATKPEPLRKLEEAASKHASIFEYLVKEIPYFRDAPILDETNFRKHADHFVQAVCRQEVEFLGHIREGRIHNSAIDTVVSSQNNTAIDLVAGKLLFRMAGLNVIVGPLGENRKALDQLPQEIRRLDEGLNVVGKLKEELSAGLTKVTEQESDESPKVLSMKLYQVVQNWFNKNKFELLFLYQLGYSDNGKLVGALGAKEGLTTCIEKLFNVLNSEILSTVEEIAGSKILPAEMRKVEVFCSRLQTFLGLGSTPGRSGGLVNFGLTKGDCADVIYHLPGKELGHLMWTIQGNAKTFNQLHAAVWAMFLEEVLSAQAQSIIRFILNGETKSPVLDYLGNAQKDRIENFIFGEFLADYGLSKDIAKNKRDFLTFFDLFLMNKTIKEAKTSLRPGFRSVPKDADDNRAIGTQVAQLSASFNYTMIVGIDLEGALKQFGGPEGFTRQLEQDEHLRLTFASIYYQFKMVDWTILRHSLNELLADKFITDEEKQIIAAYFSEMIKEYNKLKASLELIPDVEQYVDKWNVERVENAKMHNRRWRIKMIELGKQLRKIDAQLQGLSSELDGEPGGAKDQRMNDRSEIVDQISRVNGAIQAVLWISG